DQISTKDPSSSGQNWPIYLISQLSKVLQISLHSLFLQIFPVPDEKERLPSIVVEPTELSEVESGELRWPPENMEMEEDEEDLFLEQCIPPANIQMIVIITESAFPWRLIV
uniref:LBH domain-containing protein n=1 Tax=Sparus aurata TaxID=8175 RepID=A0A671V2V5_SPAAU